MMKRREVILAWVPWTVVLLLVCSSAVVVQHTQAKQIEAKEELVRLHNEVLANQRDLQSHHLELASRGVWINDMKGFRTDMESFVRKIVQRHEAEDKIRSDSDIPDRFTGADGVRLEARFNEEINKAFERLQQLEKMYSEQLQELDDRLRLLEQRPQTN